MLSVAPLPKLLTTKDVSQMLCSPLTQSGHSEQSTATGRDT